MSLSKFLADRRWPAVWVGAVSRNWHNPDNWENRHMPEEGDDVIIPSGTSVTVDPCEYGAERALDTLNSVTVGVGASVGTSW